MQTEADFMQAIIADPDSDELRLVFSDWLEEHGNTDRAEFIRLQIDMAKISPWTCEYGQLRDQTAEIYQRNKETWKIGEPFCGEYYRRGFVENVEFILSSNIDLIERAFERTPVRHLCVWCTDETLPELAKRKILQRLRGVEFIYAQDNFKRYYDFVKSIHLKNLHTFSFRMTEINESLLEQLKSCSFASDLKTLRFQEDEFVDDIVSLLAECPEFSNIRELSITADPIIADEYWDEYLDSVMSAAEAEALADSLHLTALERIDLNGQLIGERGFQALVQSTNMRTVREFRVGQFTRTEIGPEGIEALVHSPNAGQLESLDLRRNPIKNAGVILLAQWEGLARLRQLNLGDCDIGNKGAQALAKSPYLQPHTMLNLGGNPISEDILKSVRKRIQDTLIMEVHDDFNPAEYPAYHIAENPYP